MNAHSKPDRGRLTVVIFLLNAVAVAFTLIGAYRFATSYLAADQYDSAKPFADPGSILLTPPTQSQSPISLTQQQHDAIAQWTRNITPAAKLVEQSLVSPRPSNHDLRNHFQALTDPQIPLSEKRDHAVLLLTTEPTDSDRKQVEPMLKTLLQNPGDLGNTLVLDLSKHWIAPNNYQMSSLLRQLTRKAEATDTRSPNFYSRSGMRIDLTPARIPEPPTANPTNPAQRKSSQAAKTETKTQPSNPRSAKDFLRAIAESPTDPTPWSTLATQPIESSLRSELRGEASRLITAETKTQTPRLEALPEWIDRVAVMDARAGNRDLTRALQSLLTLAPANQVSETEVRRVLAWSLADGDDQWSTAILNWLPTAVVTRSPNQDATSQHAKLFVEGSWPTATASVIQFLIEGNTDQLADWIERDTISAAIAREVLAREPDWSPAVVRSIVASAAEPEAAEADRFAWLQRSAVNESTRTEFRRLIGDLPNTEAQDRCRVRLLVVADPLAQDEACQRLFVGQHGRAMLWSLLARELAIGRSLNWPVVDEALAKAEAEHGPIDPSASTESAARVDAYLAVAIMNANASPAMSSVADRVGGPITRSLINRSRVHSIDKQTGR